MIKLLEVTTEALPLCRLLYNAAFVKVPFSLLGEPELTFDSAIQNPNAIFKLIIEEDEKGEQIAVGIIGLEKIRWVERTAQTMMSVLPAHQNAGVALEASKLMMKEMVDRYNLRRVTGICDEGSHAEMIAKKLKFVKEGTLRQARFVDGVYLNSVIYSWIRGYDESIEGE